MKSSDERAGAAPTPRGLTFGAAAQAYERYRLGYPEEVVELVLAHATRQVRTAVEIGAGTGKATRLFVGAGLGVTALEPDPDMLTQLEQHVGGDARPVLATFEDADLADLSAPSGTVDLVYAAAALHWTDPTTRWPRIASLLAPGGVVASFGGPRFLADEALREEVRRVREPDLLDDDVPSPDGTPPDAPLQWPATEMQDSIWFDDVRQVVLERSAFLSADDFVGHLSTVSAYLLLPDAQRADVLARIRSVLPDQVEVTADITVHLARRTDAAVA